MMEILKPFGVAQYQSSIGFAGLRAAAFLAVFLDAFAVVLAGFFAAFFVLFFFALARAIASLPCQPASKTAV
jgi:hypothetical protein